jgi:hypothetical protein
VTLKGGFAGGECIPTLGTPSPMGCAMHVSIAGQLVIGASMILKHWKVMGPLGRGLCVFHALTGVIQLVFKVGEGLGWGCAVASMHSVGCMILVVCDSMPLSDLSTCSMQAS